MEGKIIKSKTDWRKYRYIELENGIRCILIKDKWTQSSCASLDIKVGSLNDPREIPGLAHLCERMILLASKKYPVEGEFASFVKNHGGKKESYINYSHSNFSFTVAKSKFWEALDKFSECFKSPLFNKDSINNEIRAIESEHRKRSLNDENRVSQLVMSEANPESRLNRFPNGSRKTLSKPDISKDLLEFYHTRYSANLICLVLIGNHPLDTLQEYSVKYFSGVPKLEGAIQEFTKPPPFDAGRLGKLYKIVSVSSKSILRINWVISSNFRHYKTKPIRYVTHFLGHEGPNSLLSVLVDREYAFSLCTSYELKDVGMDFIQVSVNLTEYGLREFDNEINLIKER